MRSIVWPFFCLSLFAAAPTKVGIQGSTLPQQAIVEFDSTYAGACTVTVSESPSYSPVVNDVNTSLFAGSNVAEAGAGHRTFIIGHRTAELALDGKLFSRSLAAGTAHYGLVTCDGSSAPFVFTTANLAGITPMTIPFNTAGHGNLAYPPFSFTDRNAYVVDPTSGAKMYRVTDPTDRSFVQAANFAASSVLSGTSWTDLQNLASGSTGTLATTATTNWACIPIDATTPRTFGGYSIVDSTTVYAFQSANIAAHLYGSVTDTSGENGKAQIALSIDSCQTAYTDVVDTAAFTGSATDRGLTPSTGTSPGYIGWSKPIPANYRMSRGYVTVSGSTVTLTNAMDDGGSPIALTTKFSAMSWFRPEWAVGTRIFITGSSVTLGCPNSWCTVTAVTDRDTLTISESGTISSQVTYKSGAYALMIRKKTATGSMSVSASFSELAYTPLQQGQQTSCSNLEVSTTKSASGAALGYTQYGHLCLFNVVRDSVTQLYFVGTRPQKDFRILSLVPRSGLIAGYPTDDQPRLDPGFSVGPSAAGLSFSSTDANSFYLMMATRAAGDPPAVWKLTYPSANEYVSPSGIANSFSLIGGIGGYTDPLVWANITRQSLNMSISQQILANTTYNETLWGSLNGLQFGGLIDGYFQFYRQGSAQDLPAAVFLFTEAGVFSYWYDMMGNGPGGARFAGLHSSIPYSSLSTHNMVSNLNSVLFGGPFQAAVTCVYKSGTCNANTSVSGTIGSATYDSACGTLSADLQAIGGVGNQCLKLRIAGEPCSATPTTAEKAAYPCPSDANKSWIGSAIAPFDGLQDMASPAPQDDDEQLVIATVTAVGGGVLELLIIRDAATGYRCNENNQATNPTAHPGRNCIGSDGQSTHANGWSFYMTPRGTYQTINPTTHAFSFENEWIIRGHADRSFPGGTQSFVGGCCYPTAGYGARVGGVIGGNATAYLAYWPSFGGVAADGGGATGYTQSYIASSGGLAVGLQRERSGDWRHINDTDGGEPEQPGENVGTTHTFALEGGTTAVYRVCGAVNCATNPSGISGSYDPKKTQLMVWTGAYVFQEKSSATTGNTLTDSDAYKFCYAVAAGECRSGSPAGALYVVAPGLSTDVPQCQVSQISFRSLCVFAATTVLGNTTETRVQQDSTGLYQRRLGSNMTIPGAGYAFSHSRPLPDGTAYLSSVYQQGGWFSGVALIDPGPWIQDAANRTQFQPIAVQFSAPSWFLRFGYTDALECTPRAEACQTANSSISASIPFTYRSESITPVVGAGTVVIPAIPGRILKYAIVSSGVQGPIQTIAVP